MQDSSIILQFNGISKNFGAVHALKDVTFSVNKGEIHALLGENGAGKSTLIKILSGEYSPDSGTVSVAGEQIKSFHPLVSRSFGISVVHQELSIFENLTVYENIFPYKKEQSWLIPRKDLIKKTEESMSRLNIHISPTAKMADLRLSVQQMVEILRALSDNARIVLLDEPTSGLNTQETSILMKVLKQLRNDGITIIYISHRISEIIEISDRVTVLRDGSYITTFKNDENLSQSKLISSMVGRDFEKSIYSKKKSTITSDAKIVFEAAHFTKGTTVIDASLQLRAGEILGVFGLEGSGTYELSRMLFGLHSKDSGSLKFNGKEIKNITPTHMIENGILYLNNNRKDAGLFFKMSIADNMAAPVLDRLTKRWLLSKRMIQDYTLSYVDQFSIILNSIYDTPGSLSGGNQQKVMLSICLGTKPQMIIVNEPTRGIDVSAKQEILNFLKKFVNEGVSILCFSSELPELITLSDRIAVMNTGRIAGIIECDDINENSVMRLAAMELREIGKGA
jgi:ABC-type sugar transport system ATPase subunit